MPRDVVKVFPKLTGLSNFEHGGKYHYSKLRLLQMLKMVSKIGSGLQRDIKRTKPPLMKSVDKINDFYKNLRKRHPNSTLWPKLESINWIGSTAMKYAARRLKQHNILEEEVREIKRANAAMADPICYSILFHGKEYVVIKPLQ